MKEITVHYFTAQWCAPCKTFGPRLTAFAQKFAEARVILEKHDIDEEPNLASNLGVMSVPQVILSKSGDVYSPDAILAGGMVSVPNVRESIKRILEL